MAIANPWARPKNAESLQSARADVKRRKTTRLSGNSMSGKKATPHTHFASAQEFRAWLAGNHTSASELWVGFYKKSAKRPGTTYAEALDEALCYGWIDGVRYAVDALSYKIRFTPRKAESVWSLVNVRHVKRLTRLGKVAEPGLQAFQAREQRRTGIYSFEQKRPGLAAKHKKIFRANAAAWKFFSNQAPWYQRTAGYWVSSAKRKETQQRRLAKLIADSKAGRRIDRLNPKAK
jgi:uncharacterized protein YdeI (YjbR/CyaY-like superfamily)